MRGLAGLGKEWSVWPTDADPKRKGSDNSSLPFLYRDDVTEQNSLGRSRGHVLLGEAAEVFISHGVLDRHVGEDLAIPQHIR
ncbi:MAG: hypothetical protein K2Z81_19900, partial [Cyanobacteria bacterium]|nr:hypothetical protein [Cyanobacteriota bacterium]